LDDSNIPSKLQKKIVITYYTFHALGLKIIPSACEMTFCSAKFQCMGTENANFSFTCMETYFHNENSLEIVGESWVRPVYSFYAYFLQSWTTFSLLFRFTVDYFLLWVTHQNQYILPSHH